MSFFELTPANDPTAPWNDYETRADLQGFHPSNPYSLGGQMTNEESKRRYLELSGTVVCDLCGVGVRSSHRLSIADQTLDLGHVCAAALYEDAAPHEI